MSTITTINASDLITNSRTDINNNFSALNTDKIETSYLDTDTTLAANSDTKIATQKAVKTYVDTGGNVNASETTKGIAEEATDAEVVARTATGATGAKLFITPAKIGNILKFGGTGADGALSITSGATNIDLGNAAVVIKNYTTISITGTGSLTFTNPHTNGTVIILKSQGSVVLTSSATPMIDARSTGSAASTASYFGSFFVNSAGGGGSGGLSPSTGATGGSMSFDPISVVINAIALRYPYLVIGSGGGSGGATNGGGGTGVAGTGARGAGALIIECGGAWNFTTTNGVNVGGADGGNGSWSGGGANSAAAGGGGGGGGGSFIALYNSLIANTGTVVVAGGAGGTVTGGTGTGNYNATGGGGGSGKLPGGSTANNGSGWASGSGAAGGAGYSLVTQNTEFA